jgi:hypothetical protein
MPKNIPSPNDTQVREFSQSRLWVLDPGKYTAEVWWTGEFDNGGSESRFQTEVELGFAPHLQLDVYFNVQVNFVDATAITPASSNLGDHTGVAVELRWAIPDYWGETFMNPTLYFEYKIHDDRDEPDVADHVDHERLDARSRGGGAPVPEGDQQVGRRADERPPHDEDHEDRRPVPGLKARIVEPACRTYGRHLQIPAKQPTPSAARTASKKRRNSDRRFGPVRAVHHSTMALAPQT